MHKNSIFNITDKLRKLKYELRIISCLWTILKIDCVLTEIHFLDGMSGKVYCLVKFVVPYLTSWYNFKFFGLDHKFLGCFSKSLYSWSQLSEEIDFNVRLLWDEFWTKKHMTGKCLVRKAEISLWYNDLSWILLKILKEKDDCGIIQECEQNSVHKVNDKK